MALTIWNLLENDAIAAEYNTWSGTRTVQIVRGMPLPRTLRRGTGGMSPGIGVGWVKVISLVLTHSFAHMFPHRIFQL